MKMNAPSWLPIRYVFTFLAFIGFVFNYTLRVNINLVITSMVNHTALNDTDHYKLGTERKAVSVHQIMLKHCVKFLYERNLQLYIANPNKYFPGQIESWFSVGFSCN